MQFLQGSAPVVSRGDTSKLVTYITNNSLLIDLGLEVLENAVIDHLLLACLLTPGGD